MADGIVQVPPDSTGKKVDAASMDVGSNTVYRQRIVIGDNSASDQFATVTAGSLLCTGTFNISSMPAVALSGTATVAGVINVSAMPAITGTVNISGTAAVSLPANIGTVNNISAAVVLAAGTANIGSINNVSATVTVAFATPQTLNNISRTVQVQLTTPFTLNNISATVIVAGEVANGASLSTTNKPVLIGGNTSAGGAGGLMVTQLLDTTGRVLLGAGTANIGAVSLGAGTANIGSVNNISATVTVAGVVGLTAGTAVIGDINAISRTVQVAIGTPFTLNNVSATVTVAGVVGLTAGTANIGFINNISATVTVVGIVNISATATVVIATGNNNIGTINNISRTAAVGLAYVTEFSSGSLAVVGDVANNAVRVNVINAAPTGVPSASHGPKCVTCSTSANVTLVAAPGSGLSIYVTMIAVSNASNTGTRAYLKESASVVEAMYLTSLGGGAVLRYDPPWKLSANTVLNCAVDPAASDVLFNVNFYVAA